MFIELDEAISIMYLPIRLLQPERQKKRQKIKTTTTTDDIEMGDNTGIDSVCVNWLYDRSDCDE